MHRQRYQLHLFCNNAACIGISGQVKQARRATRRDRRETSMRWRAMRAAYRLGYNTRSCLAIDVPRVTVNGVLVSFAGEYRNS